MSSERRGRVLVTGVNGLIGQEVAAQLAARGEWVRGFDLKPAATWFANYEHVEGDVTDSSRLMQAMQGCTQVIHLAAMMGVNRTDQNPKGCLDVNILGTRAVVRYAESLGLEHVLVASSSEVYGRLQSQDGFKEGDPTAPISVYGISKLAGEAYAKALGDKATIVRFFNVYGPRQEPNFVMSRFVRAALAPDGVLEVYGGEQVRAFCHVADAARAVVALAERRLPGTFNIGNPTEPITMRQLAHVVLEELGDPSAFDLRSRRLAMVTPKDRTTEREIQFRKPDISTIRHATGWHPRMSLRAGIHSIVEHLREEAA